MSVISIAIYTVPSFADVKNDIICGHVNPSQNHYSKQFCMKAKLEAEPLCQLIAKAADGYDLPRGFLARLLWTESRFDPMARSHKGAMGIAQFIRSTAKLRNLDDPYHPIKAIDRSAHYLDDLRNRFGSLGLAAVAYNGGEGRASNYLKGGGLPFETERYVQLITGQSADMWRQQKVKNVDFSLSKDKGFMPACITLAQSGKLRQYQQQQITPQMPYSVILASHFREGQAIRMYNKAKNRFNHVIGTDPRIVTRGRAAAFGRRLQYFAGVGKPTFKSAQSLCQKIRQRSGFCKVIKVR